jgi:MarR family transcriptional regulator, transcriptional regulator for hemolysin
MKLPASFDQIIAILTRTFAELETQALQESELADLTMKQIVYLDTIARMQSPTFSDLAKQLDVSKPSVTAIVHKLVKNGYVQKVQSEEDKRAFHILLTEKGHELAAIHDNLHQKIAQHFTNVLNEAEMHQLGRLLHKAFKDVQL